MNMHVGWLLWCCRQVACRLDRADRIASSCNDYEISEKDALLMSGTQQPHTPQMPCMHPGAYALAMEMLRVSPEARS